MDTVRTAVIALLACTTALGGGACRSTKTIHPSAEPGKPVYGRVKAGDKVTLHMNDGRRLEIRVSQLDDEGVVSMEGVRYFRRDIVRLERRSLSVAKTTALVAGLVFGAVVVAGIMVASAVDSILSGGQ